MPTNLLRQVRVAQESRLLASHAPPGLPPLSVAPARAPDGESERATPLPSGSGLLPLEFSPPITEIMTYEVYKQRFVEDCEESRQQARAEGLALGQREGRPAGRAEYH